ncbi:unnamed protein product [Mytilus edulis]|uniref:Uncharacterized protein n=1 Tax=Mytilus edulis TaxID=6550 RepID=A0A8S3QCS0_MYTED|nr:unnamed protein product [Mytilus edulis]
MLVVSSVKKSTIVNLNDMSQTILEEVVADKVALFKGNIYGTIYSENKVCCYKSTGEALWTFQHNDIVCPRGITLDKNGFVYVVSGYNNRVVVVSPDGKTCKTILSEADGIKYPKLFLWFTKIHKSEEISNAISEQNSEYIELLTPNDLKCRPIVGGPNSVTQNLSHFIDIVLKPLCREVPSFIRDDLEFLNHLPKTVNPNSELITFDIVSLYTNIPHDLGITAVKYWLENTENVIENRLTKEFILASLKLILERNIFYFNGTYYHQKKGTAMGTKMAPSYATLVLGYLEQLLYEK